MKFFFITSGPDYCLCFSVILIQLLHDVVIVTLQEVSITVQNILVQVWFD